VLSDAARRRFGIELPYEEQLDWGITRLKPEQLELCIQETHCRATIIAAEPYPGAVETVKTWKDQGHFVHITSHRDGAAHDATAAWLDRIGLPHDDLHCSFDKVSRCVELDIDVLIDDSPINIARALEAGITAATIRHPWNRDVCEEEDVVCAEDWSTLAQGLAPILVAQRASAA
jgi:hypothetical protein